jgi:transaldolase
MNSLQQLRDLGQSLWLDNITRDLLDNGTSTMTVPPTP